MKNHLIYSFFILLFISNVYSFDIQKEVNILSDLEEVKYIQEVLPLQPEDMLMNSTSKVNVNNLYSSPYDLDGNGIIIFQYEKGVPDKTHSDLVNRVSWTGDEVSEHATHVAGILIGNGSIDSDIVGIAPKATIRADVVSGASYNQTGLSMPYDYYWAINMENIDVASNSWGYSVVLKLNNTNKEHLCSYYGDYGAMASMFDSIVSGDFTYLLNSVEPKIIVFAAGNERNGTYNPCTNAYNEDYPYSTISPPNNAKNIISVGATYSYNNAIASFSSYGPTDEGLLKPEIVAPGCDSFNKSGNSLFKGIISTFPENMYSRFIGFDAACGTSMAAPHVSGTIALMLEQWNLSGFTSDPLPSTIKAMLLDSATDLKNDGSGAQVIDGPDYINGFGLLNAKEAVNRIRDETFIEANLTDENDVDVYAIQVNSGDEIKVTLAWDDIPGANLINDLDIKLISPKGNTFYPWHLYPNNPSADATRNVGPFLEDHDNVVEQVYVTSFEVNSEGTGEWLVVVSSSALPYDEEQKYSLVSDREISTTITSYNSDYSNLILYYPFNTTANDYSGNLNHGSIYQATSSTDKDNNINSCYYLDGIDDYITMPRLNLFNGNDNFSISFWFNTDNINTPSNDHILFDLRGDNKLTIGFTYILGDGVLDIRGRNYNTWQSIVSVPNITEQKWYHVIITYNTATGMKMYLNSQLIDTYPNKLSLGSSTVSTNYIGTTTNFLADYEGKLDEISIWDKTLSDIEVIRDYIYGVRFTPPVASDQALEADSSLIAHYPLNGNGQDLSGNDNDINVSNASLTSDKDMNSNSAYYLDGIDDYISLPNYNIFDGSENFSVSFWFNAYNASSGNDISSIFDFRGENKITVGFTYILGNETLDIRSQIGGTWQSVGSKTNINENQWYHATYTYSTLDGWNLYINGVNTNTGSSVTGTIATNIGYDASYIGKNDYDQDYYNGVIDEISIWDKPLSATEASKLYDNGIRYS